MEKNSQGQNSRPFVGIGILILNDSNEVLLGLRKGAHGEGEWSFPGGHLEFGETVFETAKRETKEETNLDVDEMEVISVADEMRYISTDNKHYLNIGVQAKYKGGEPTVMEPHKCKEWKWFTLNNLPDNLFEATGLTIENMEAHRIYKTEQMKRP